MRRVRIRLFLLPLLALGTGCYSGYSADAALTFGNSDGGDDGGDGASGADSGDSGDGDGDSDDPPEVVCGDAPLQISAAPLRRLTSEQYRNTIADLFEGYDLGDSTDRLDLMIDGKAGEFASTTTPADTEVARNYLLLAENISATAFEQGLGTEQGCDIGTASCVEAFLADFGRRAFRRPLSAEEHARYIDLWSSQNAQPEAALQTVVTALLASPNFLYLEEPVLDGAADTSVLALEPYALASRLSYFLWASTPDGELLDAADAGALLDENALRTQVDRMIESPKFDRALASFHLQWTRTSGLDSFQSSDPAWTSTMGSSMKEELVRFTRHVFRDGEGTLDELLTANYTFVDGDLAALYGVEAPAVDFERVELDATQRAGLLTQAGFLAKTGAIFPAVHRGLFIRHSLQCYDPPPPPEDLARDRFDEHRENPSCAGCHIFMDPIGFGFNAYDSLGRYQTHLDGAPIDSSGEIVPSSVGGAEGTFDGAVELGYLLAGSEEVEHCMAKQWSRFATGRLETDADVCAMNELAQEVTESGGDLRALVRSVATSTWFRNRSATDFAE